MWIVLMVAMLLVVLAGVFYITKRIILIPVVKNKLPGKRGCFAAAALIVLILVILSLTLGYMNAAIIFVHLIVFSLLADLVGLIASKICRKNKNKLISFTAALAFTVIWLGIGMYNAYNVVRTEYTVKTSIQTGNEKFKIVGFSDSHVGAIFHGEKFAEYVERMNAENADIAVIVGDFVDDDTSYEDMIRSCEEVGKLKTKYGTYFVFGNHDAGYFGKEYRGYDKEDLTENLTKNGIVVLEDETVRISDNIYLCGRQDSRQTDRIPMKELSEDFTEDDFVIVLDHEPNDYDEEEKAEADLVLSGHTHGGQFIPILKAGEWLGINDMTYGRDVRGKTNFIVSSGIADWAFKFKTGCISEYFVVNISD